MIEHWSIYEYCLVVSKKLQYAFQLGYIFVPIICNVLVQLSHMLICSIYLLVRSGEGIEGKHEIERIHRENLKIERILICLGTDIYCLIFLKLLSRTF